MGECPVWWNRLTVSSFAQSHIVMAALVAAIHVFGNRYAAKTWIPATDPRITSGDGHVSGG